LLILKATQQVKGRNVILMKIPIIDQKFLDEWEPEYDVLACDYVNYSDILQEVQRELAQNGNISKETAQTIVTWKVGAVYDKVKWHLYNRNYAPRFSLAISNAIGDHNKLKILVWNRTKLEALPYRLGTFASIIGDSHGIGTPLASAFLHFIFPNRFPIIDIRVSEVLYLCGIIKSTETNERDYDKFRPEILKMARRLGRPLRTVDKALFAYHKGYLQEQMNSKFVELANTTKFPAASVGVSLRIDTGKKFRKMIIDTLKKDP
jgi:hypothetical protein